MAKLRTVIVCDSCIKEGYADLKNHKERNNNTSVRARKRSMANEPEITRTSMPYSGRDPQNEAAQACALKSAKIAAECHKSAFEALTGIESVIDEVCDSSIG